MTTTHIIANQVEITTKDGTCPAFVYRPAGTGPWPAVLVFMDGLGIRPAMLEIGERLADNGYSSCCRISITARDRTNR